VSKYNHCIRCGTFPNEKDKYCRHCGAPLINRCTHDGGPAGDPCNNENEPHSAFCSKCGAPTTFNRAGLIQSPYPAQDKNEVNDWDEMRQFSSKFFTR
jgi:hypothetical protein